MPLGQLLLDRGLIDLAQLEEARSHRKVAGGSLLESLVALRCVSDTELEALLGEAPPAPESIEDTGLDPRFLLDFVLKAAYVTGYATAADIACHIALPDEIVADLLDAAKEQRLVEVLGLADTLRGTYRYALTTSGRSRAIDALQQCQYTGPAPVPLDAYRLQVAKQSITRETVTPAAMAAALSHLTLPEGTIERLGPAANCGKALLLYGAPGNGKTSIAEALGAAFERLIHFPYCVEAGGQIIRIYDSALHVPGSSTPEGPSDDEERPDIAADPRWVRCRRPVVVVGGELTIETLDLSFDPISKFYEAPAHVKALGGVFIIDDFGRQRVRPLELLNRWIIPLERRVDYLTLHTGMKLEVPFDELVVFSTNFPPGELLDEASLRRITYKLHVPSPTPGQYETILRGICAARELPLPDDVLPYLFDSFYPATGIPVSAVHPKFIVDHVLERCRFEGVAPRLDLGLVHEAVQNLLVEGEAPEPLGG